MTRPAGARGALQGCNPRADHGELDFAQLPDLGVGFECFATRDGMETIA